jgi:hypothetical protein
MVPRHIVFTFVENETLMFEQEQFSCAVVENGSSNYLLWYGGYKCVHLAAVPARRRRAMVIYCEEPQSLQRRWCLR